MKNKTISRKLSAADDARQGILDRSKLLAKYEDPHEMRESMWIAARSCEEAISTLATALEIDEARICEAIRASWKRNP